MKNHNKSVHMITFMLLILGGINTGIFINFGWDIGQLLGGAESMLTRIFYSLVGLAAVYELLTHKHNCAKCASKPSPAPTPTSQPTPGM